MNQSEKTKVLVILLSIIVYATLIPVGTILGGWTFSILWGWFAVPIFGLPALGVAQAVGVTLLFGFPVSKMPKQEKEDKEPGEGLAWVVAWTFIKPAMFLTVGWIAKSLM